MEDNQFKFIAHFEDGKVIERFGDKKMIGLKSSGKRPKLIELYNATESQKMRAEMAIGPNGKVKEYAK